MVRSMYSGVSGMRAHQTRMDSIGNNIANVNTYGFKSSRTTFRDIYYQTMSAAAGPNAAQGGMNPSQVGYGSKVGSVDLMMSRSTFSMTDQTMDVAIDGDGFLQVMDSAGNIYYTRAGMLGFDSAGNLVDMQGNFVLGVNGDPTGRAPGSEKIQVLLPDVQPTNSSVEQTIFGKKFTISSSNATQEGNLNFNFTTDASLADDEVKASITPSGITIAMHPDNQYSNWAQLNTAINNAITSANQGKEHPAGQFTIGMATGQADPFAAGPLSAADICSTDNSIQLGTVSFGGETGFFGGMYPTAVGNKFSGDGTLEEFTCEYDDGPPKAWKVKLKIDDGTTAGKVYEGIIEDTKTSGGDFYLSLPGGDKDDTIKMKRPSFNDITTAWKAEFEAANPTLPVPDPPTQFTALTSADKLAGLDAATPSAESRALGFTSTAFALRKGTEGGPQGLQDMTNINIAPNGMIIGNDSQGTQVVIGRIDLATFANQVGLDQAGSSNYMETANSGAPKIGQPGTGGAGKLVGGSLELSNVDLSREFSDMITTQRGYQANSRIITVSDTMLEELINLKR